MKTINAEFRVKDTARFQVQVSGIFPNQWVVWDSANELYVSDAKWTSEDTRAPMYFDSENAAHAVAAEMLNRVAAL